MHVPDGFIDAPVSIAAGVAAAGAVAVSLRGARRELEDSAAPLAGLVAAFIFAVQMLNFPVAAGDQRTPARRRARRDTRRPLHRCALRVGGAAHAGRALRRRRSDRPRRQRHEHGRRHRPRRLRRLPRPGEGPAQDPPLGHRRRLHRRTCVRTRRGRHVHPLLRPRWHHRRTARQGVHRHGRRARPHRHRRGGHHRRDGRRGARRTPRPGARRARTEHAAQAARRR